jgi:hypothetical protein
MNHICISGHSKINVLVQNPNTSCPTAKKIKFRFKIACFFINRKAIDKRESNILKQTISNDKQINQEYNEYYSD